MHSTFFNVSDFGEPLHVYTSATLAQDSPKLISSCGGNHDDPPLAIILHRCSPLCCDLVLLSLLLFRSVPILLCFKENASLGAASDGH